MPHTAQIGHRMIQITSDIGTFDDLRHLMVAGPLPAGPNLICRGCCSPWIGPCRARIRRDQVSPRSSFCREPLEGMQPTAAPCRGQLAAPVDKPPEAVPHIHLRPARSWPASNGPHSNRRRSMVRRRMPHHSASVTESPARASDDDRDYFEDRSGWYRGCDTLLFWLGRTAGLAL